MNKKGFTLIELLAVIIILAVIALIATPVVLNVVENARREANKNSVYGLLDAAKYYYADSLLDSNKASNINGTTNLYGDIKVSGDKPPSGEIYINSNGEIALAVVYGEICYTKNFADNNINESEDIANCSIYKNVEFTNLISMDDYIFNSPTIVEDTKVLKVLVIDIDPIMTKGSIQGKSCVGITASECLGQNKQQVIDELIMDIEESSHNIIDVQIVKTDYINEFATHKNQATLIDGTKANRLDEDTWLDMMKNGWYGFWNYPANAEFGSYSLDYQYLIDNLNLVSRRNNGEFDEVWLVNVDLTQSYESIMVGKTAYWINGKEIKADCNNFKIMNVSISRPDTNYECNGHAAEDILDNVFGATNTTSYNENNIAVSSDNYDNLTLWQKFTLVEYNNSNKGTGLSGPGNVHFSPNSTDDYDWNNTTDIVTGKWSEWENYPYLTSDVGTEVFTPNVYMSESITGTDSTARRHHRWWFSLMPHLTGYTQDGYSNNWWDYIYNGDFVTSIVASKTDYTYNVGDVINDIEVTNNYKSTKTETIILSTYETNMSFSDKSIFGVTEDGQIVATSKGASVLTYYRDGKSITINIIVQ